MGADKNRTSRALESFQASSRKFTCIGSGLTYKLGKYVGVLVIFPFLFLIVPLFFYFKNSLFVGIKIIISHGIYVSNWNRLDFFLATNGCKIMMKTIYLT